MHFLKVLFFVVALSTVANHAEAQPADVKKWLDRHDALDGWCRGDSENPLTEKACSLRENVDRELAKLDWCYGRKNEAGYQKRWHACGSDSERPNVVGLPPVNIDAFYGVWGSVTDHCRSFKAQTEGPYFTIRPRRYVPQGGGNCRKLTFQLKGETLTVRGQCTEEEAGFAPLNDRYTLVGSTLKSAAGDLFQRCAP